VVIVGVFIHSGYRHLRNAVLQMRLMAQKIIVSRSCPGGERIVYVVPGVRAELGSGKDSAVKDC
jgi:hypothetical protein